MSYAVYTSEQIRTGILGDVEKAELRACLKIAMKEWEGWMDSDQGIAPSGPDWDRCLAALGEAWE